MQSRETNRRSVSIHPFNQPSFNQHPPPPPLPPPPPPHSSSSSSSPSSTKSLPSSVLPLLSKLLLLFTILASLQFLVLSKLPQSDVESDEAGVNTINTISTVPPPGPSITYAVSLTSCSSSASNPGNGNKHDSHLTGLSDGSRVLKWSIEKAHENSRYKNVKYAAFVHESAEGSPCADILEEMGFEVMNVPTPVTVSEIQHQSLREGIVKNGCCGEKELIKFYAYTLSTDVVVHLDIDVLILRPMDGLFDGIVEGEATAYFTKDYGMVKPGKQPGIQGEGERRLEQRSGGVWRCLEDLLFV